MALVVLPVKTPAVLEGQSNGKLDSAILVSTPGLGGGPTVKFVEPASRSWRALSGSAPMVLKATSSADSYRTYAQQLATWHARYEPDPFPGFIATRIWPAHYDELGRYVAAHKWYQKPNTAVAAWPGSSNHGLALAIDVANASGARLAWLQANVVRFGWSFETQSEPWHIRYCAGDDIPAAVLAYEKEQEDMEQTEALIVATGVPGRRVGDTFADLQKLRTMLALAAGAEGNPQPQAGSLLADLRAFLDAPAPPVTMTEEDRAAIVADLTAALAPMILTEQQVEDAAFRGAQRAEDQ